MKELVVWLIHTPAGTIAFLSAVAAWPVLFSVVTLFCKEPTEWPIMFGVAIQEALSFAKQDVSQEVALQIVMEAAVPMSKVDLEAA
jgi:hypothetical protein